VSELDRNRWNRLFRGSEKKAAHWYDRLLELYSELHRHYHNVQHIGDCLNKFDSARDAAHEPLALELAIWFHDAIYNPRAADNEERSAELAEQFITETGVVRELKTAVYQLILATKHHDGTLRRDAALMVDVDLSIFGQSPERFWKYEEQIRAEYEWVPENIFAMKRAEILERFLSRDKIFRTKFFFSKYETQARANLAESVRRLRAK
jgi:predicted metal-dependent HD superfamily phosphohydrolase